MRNPFPFELLPIHAKFLAISIADHVNKNFPLELDYSPESLSLVDGFIEQIRNNEYPEDQVAKTLYCLGAYVGEVINKTLGGRWINRIDFLDVHMKNRPLIVGMPNGAKGDPIGKVLRYYEDETAESITSFYEVFSIVSSVYAE